VVAGLADRVLDLGLNVISTESAAIYLCANEPTDYAGAMSSALGYKLFGVGAVFGAPYEAADGNRRCVSMNPITDGTFRLIERKRGARKRRS
jgi:hypothetical protein